MMNFSHFSQSGSDLVAAAVRAAAAKSAATSSATVATYPFITISREAGASAHAVASRLAHELNRRLYQDERSWECLDRDMLNKIAADHNLSVSVMESLEQNDHNWLSELLEGMPGQDGAATSELKIFHHTAAAIRTLAQSGRVVLVGCGAAYITHDMPGGVHIRLVAPMQFRIDSTAHAEKLTQAQATAKVEHLDRNRDAFYRRYWPDRPLSCEQFTLTINVAELTEDQVIAAILAIVP